MAAELSIQTEIVDTVALVRLVGTVDAASYSLFKESLERITQVAAPLHVAIDCSGLAFIDSKGLGLLTGLHRKAINEMGRMVLFGVSPRIQKSLDLLGLESRLSLYPDQPAALDSFSTSAGES